MWLELTISPSTSSSGSTRVSKRPSAAQQRRVAARPVAEAEVLADRDRPAPSAPTITSSMNCSGGSAASSSVNGTTTSSATPSPAMSWALRSSVVSSGGAPREREHRRWVRVERDDGVVAGDHRPVAEVHAVEEPIATRRSRGSTSASAVIVTRGTLRRA